MNRRAIIENVLSWSFFVMLLHDLPELIFDFWTIGIVYKMEET